ncbi:hypothetical protein L226DRAFT_491808 [Lentinus tigrinus ALCF2SS1-7]|uniref:Zn(2)-C6 fungal-type domain-containing protein n=1 Tax=Lentinus tigrinus ALCF2SS1-6 TaxID=1328759 RepID=A0A5C2RUE5_9APHY|nr:hypothetical protein L227DRAFT_533342 [Lentinus tigrinus ALCF2SS1-6]RPD71299.1 hypothetical protein L226DRAFT_491808 [Lentinus tigrinus ALCF2SS1-7]
MVKTCALCRERSVHCDGIQPRCGQCTEFGALVVCDFSSRAAGPSSKNSNLLQKGAACLPCRKRKKKCDAKRPFCTTCEAAKKQSQCLYEDDAQRNLIQSLVARTRELEERLASAERSPRSSPPHQGYTTPSPRRVPVQWPGNFATESIGVFPAWEPPVIDVPLPSSCPTSRITLEQYREFRLHFISFSDHVGVKLTPAATTAVATGDYDSPHIHPSLIHAAQLLGCVMWQEINHTTSLAPMELFELESAISFLTANTAPLVKIQVYNVLAMYYYIKHMFPEGSEHTRLGTEVALRHGLRFTTSSWDPLVEPSPEDEQMVCALSHLFYITIDRQMVLGIPSELGPEYDEDFQSIPVMYPTLSRSHVAILRARGALLLHRARQLSARLSALPSCPWELHLSQGAREETSGWVAEYWSLIEEVEANLASVNPALLKASLRPDLQRATQGLKITLIVALTAEALLHHLAPRFHPESRQHCLNAVLKLVGIGKTFSANDYEMLDPILGVCWQNAANVAFAESARPMDELSAMNWATARSVLLACAPVIAKSLPYLEGPMNQILERAAAFGILA